MYLVISQHPELPQEYRVHSRHRTVQAALTASHTLAVKVRARNGSGSYLPGLRLAVSRPQQAGDGLPYYYNGCLTHIVRKENVEVRVS